MNSQRSPLRALAPLSLVAVGVALLLIVGNADVGGSDEGSSRSGKTSTEERTSERTQEETTTQETTEKRAEKYEVKAGDTLAAIAERTGTTVERLLELNPNLDPNAMRSGQEICLQPSSDCGS